MAIWNDRIKELRKSHDMTLKFVAEYLGTTEATAQRYESGNGIKNIPYEIIIKYAELFHCSPSYLMGWENKKNADASESVSLSPQMQAILDVIKDMTSGQLDMILSYAEFVKENKAGKPTSTSQS